MRLALWQGTFPAADIDAACAKAEAAQSTDLRAL